MVHLQRVCDLKEELNSVREELQTFEFKQKEHNTREQENQQHIQVAMKSDITNNSSQPFLNVLLPVSDKNFSTILNLEICIISDTFVMTSTIIYIRLGHKFVFSRVSQKVSFSRKLLLRQKFHNYNMLSVVVKCYGNLPHID